LQVISPPSSFIDPTIHSEPALQSDTEKRLVELPYQAAASQLKDCEAHQIS
jgi:hypothetical protein